MAGKRQILASAERLAAHHDREPAAAELRKLRLEEFGEVLLDMPDESSPDLSKRLPAMAAGGAPRRGTGLGRPSAHSRRAPG